jgi:hypothetical protein
MLKFWRRENSRSKRGNSKEQDQHLLLKKGTGEEMLI